MLRCIVCWNKILDERMGAIMHQNKWKIGTKNMKYIVQYI